MKRKNLTSIGIVCTIDRHGRVTVPAVMRDSMEIEPGSQLDLFVVGDKLVLRKHYPGCVLCLDTEDKLVMTPTGKQVCMRCVNRLKREVIR
ncbi:AbrB/MazE/SpoVT family DNA-binding domain-containing protein [Paenibacillus senegalensis]|uniref:AbrB/MazE/SpoVT family DNA-binding domain-containing protein n=1 Tax=Paenibacillus senegalensis TaxID=1465766 RepID=UPI000475163E|nr:AbrB/MazE/SpoVT family DNA-binding domain-containing protein [Paenibacillus senegalensis]